MVFRRAGLLRVAFGFSAIGAATFVSGSGVVAADAAVPATVVNSGVSTGGETVTGSEVAAFEPRLVPVPARRRGAGFSSAVGVSATGTASTVSSSSGRAVVGSAALVERAVVVLFRVRGLASLDAAGAGVVELGRLRRVGVEGTTDAASGASTEAASGALSSGGAALIAATSTGDSSFVILLSPGKFSARAANTQQWVRLKRDNAELRPPRESFNVEGGIRRTPCMRRRSVAPW